MRSHEKDIEFIERYLDNKLNADEIFDFNKRIRDDKEFHILYNEISVLIAGIKYSGRQKLVRKLKKLEADLTLKERFDKKYLNLPQKQFYTFFAAATVLCVVGFFLWFFINHKTSPYEIFIENFDPYPNAIYCQERGESVTNNRKRAYHLYDSEKYREAAKLFGDIIANDFDTASLLYEANSYLALGEFNLAISSLNRLQKMNSPFQNQAKWYLALSYLALNKPESAKKILFFLKKSNTSYSNKANKLLVKI